MTWIHWVIIGFIVFFLSVTSVIIRLVVEIAGYHREEYQRRKRKEELELEKLELEKKGRGTIQPIY